MAGLGELLPYQARAWESLNTPKVGSSQQSEVQYTALSQSGWSSWSWSLLCPFLLSEEEGCRVTFGRDGPSIVVNFEIGIYKFGSFQKPDVLNEHIIHISKKKMPSIPGIESTWTSFSTRRIYMKSILESWGWPWVKTVLEGLTLSSVSSFCLPCADFFLRLLIQEWSKLLETLAFFPAKEPRRRTLSRSEQAQLRADFLQSSGPLLSFGHRPPSTPYLLTVLCLLSSCDSSTLQWMCPLPLALTAPCTMIASPK